MTKEPKISVIVPVYNVEKYLKQTLDSLCRQTYPFLEIICINDGSTDSSIQILNEYSTKDRRIVVYNQKNKGVGTARNLGLEVSTSDWISFIDSDDLVNTNLYRCFVDSLNKSQFDIYMFNGLIVPEVFNPDDETLKKFFYLSNWTLKNDNIYTFRDCKNPFWGNLSVANKIYNKNFLSKNGIKFKEKTIFEDQLFSVESMVKANAVFMDNQNMYYYIQHPKSIMNEMGKEVFDIFEIMSDVKQILLDYDLYDYEKYVFLQHKFNVYNYLFFKLSGTLSEEFYSAAKLDLMDEVSENHDINIIKRVARSNFYFDFVSLSASEYYSKNKS